MDDELLCLVRLGVCILLSHQLQQLINERKHRGRGRGQRRWWVRPINQGRVEQGFYHNLLAEAALTDHEEYFATIRMWPEHFEWLHDQVGPLLVKRSQREPLPSKLRLLMTLKYLAQGGSVHSLHDEFRVGKSTAHKVIGETCEAIWTALQPVFLPQLTRIDWLNIAKDFFDLWQMPNCVGAIDGRHMRIKAPPMTGSQYYNYKGFFSIVLMAACDAKYKFTWVDIGQYGSISDGGIWANTDFAQALESGQLDLPPLKPLPDHPLPFPFYMVADEAFPLLTNLMRPFPGRMQRRLPDEELVFNYRLSRARRTIENAFGILAARWGVLNSSMTCGVDKASTIVKSIVCLHNMLCDSKKGVYLQRNALDLELPNGDIQQGQWRTENLNAYFKRIGRVGANRSTSVVVGMRAHLAQYFMSDIGIIQAPWQFYRAFRGTRLNDFI